MDKEKENKIDKEDDSKDKLRKMNTLTKFKAQPTT